MERLFSEPPEGWAAYFCWRRRREDVLRAERCEDVMDRVLSRTEPWSAIFPEPNLSRPASRNAEGPSAARSFVTRSTKLMTYKKMIALEPGHGSGHFCQKNLLPEQFARAE